MNQITPKTLIISFAGNALRLGGIPRKEFEKFLTMHFSQYDAMFMVDPNCMCYHHGLAELGTKDVDETVAYLKRVGEEYDRIVCIGASAGGYAAILFGSLLHAYSVVAFFPPTLLRDSDKDPRYTDVIPHLSDQTRYYIFGDQSVLDPASPHHISHCLRMAKDRDNVFLVKHKALNLSKMRFTGELYNIIKNALL